MVDGHDDKLTRCYLAGFDVFRPGAVSYGHRMKASCASRGLEGMFPTDGEPPPGLSKADVSSWIFRQNCKLIDVADVIVANMGPFRGPGMDGGTAFEMGYAFARGKLVVGYTTETNDYSTRVAAMMPVVSKAGGLWDADGFLVENFGLTDNLMMERCATAEGARPIFRSFEECLDYVAALAPINDLLQAFR